MPRKSKSPEEIESFEGSTPVEGATELQLEKEAAEKKDEIERSVKRRAPRRTKATEAAIEEAKAEIIKKMDTEERSEPALSDKPLWEKKPSKITRSAKASLQREPVTEERAEPALPERPIWEKWKTKIQEPKPAPKEKKVPWWQVWKKDWFRKSSVVAKVMSLPTIAAAGGLTDTAKSAEDTLGKDVQYAVSKTIEQRSTPRLTEIKEVPDNKKFGDMTLLGRLLVPYHKDNYEVCIAYFDGKERDPKAMEKILKAMIAEGYEPGDAKMLSEIIKENPELSKRAPYILAPVPFMDKNDQVTQETISVRTENYAPKNDATIAEEFKDNGSIIGKTYASTDTTQSTKTIIEILNAGHAAFPTAVKGKMGRFEEDQGIEFNEHGYVFYTKKPKTTAQYADGLAKSK